MYIYIYVCVWIYIYMQILYHHFFPEWWPSQPGHKHPPSRTAPMHRVATRDCHSCQCWRWIPHCGALFAQTQSCVSPWLCNHRIRKPNAVASHTGKESNHSLDSKFDSELGMAMQNVSEMHSDVLSTSANIKSSLCPCFVRHPAQPRLPRVCGPPTKRTCCKPGDGDGYWWLLMGAVTFLCHQRCYCDQQGQPNTRRCNHHHLKTAEDPEGDSPKNAMIHDSIRVHILPYIGWIWMGYVGIAGMAWHWYDQTIPTSDWGMDTRPSAWVFGCVRCSPHPSAVTEPCMLMASLTPGEKKG